MSNNFLQSDPGREPANRWRSLAALFVIVASIILAFSLNYKLPQPTEMARLSKIIEPVADLTTAEIKAGGDVVIQPPAQARPKLPELKGEMLAAEKFSARSMLVKDLETGAILFRKNEYDIRPIASLTKLMSALVILEREPDWDSSAKVVGEDVISMGTHMYAGDTYTLSDLWSAALIGSSNKAVETIVQALGWPREAFIERMNQKARELGMSDTLFVDPTGLDDGNVSTASDIAILLSEALNVDKVKQALLIPEYNLYSKERRKRHHMWNTNWLLLGWINSDFAEIRGGKTGYTPAAGYNFVMQVGNEAGKMINVVVLGTNSHEARFTEARDAAEWVFSNYTWPEN